MRLSVRTEELELDAARAQRAYLLLSRLQLGLIIAAAAVAAIPFESEGKPVNWQGVAAAVFFGASLLLRVLALKFRDEERWRTSRSSAERAKSLCFRFAYGATGFERSLDRAAAISRLDAACTELPEIVLEHDPGERAFLAEATDDMHARRALTHEEARSAYDQERLSEQESWFARKSHRNAVVSRRYLIVMVLAELAGLVFAILAVVYGNLSGLVGVCTTIAAATIAWTQVRQHSALATAYAAQARRLRGFARQLDAVTPEAWPAFVDKVEETFRSEGDEWARLMGHER